MWRQTEEQSLHAASKQHTQDWKKCCSTADTTAPTTCNGDSHNWTDAAQKFPTSLATTLRYFTIAPNTLFLHHPRNETRDRDSSNISEKQIKKARQKTDSIQVKVVVLG